MLKNKGQSTIEYTIVLIIVLGVFLSMQSYVKRAFQGRWKAAVDDLGDQYDPSAINMSVTETLFVNSDTQVLTQKDVGGFYTNRIDNSRTIEKKVGTVAVGSQF